MPDAGRFARMLHQARLRVTPQRLAILQALATGKQHVATCHAIWARARRATGGLGQMTTYRILERLHAVGLIEQFDLDGVAHFGLADRHHDHVICQRCGSVEPTATCLLGPHGDLTARLRRSGFVVKHHRLDLYGVCRACREGA